MSTATASPFSIGEARKQLADLFQPNPLIFWFDFLVSVTIGYAAASFYLSAPVFNGELVALTPWHVVSLLVAAVFLFRVALFMHEIVHFRRGEMVAFKVMWNILAGIPMLVPSFLYESHLVHHNTHHYGTGNDGEYLPLGVGPLRNILGFLAQILFLPLFVAVRFLVFTPISFLHPKLRKFVLERMSSYVINLAYRREIPDDAPRAWVALEIACCLRMVAMVTCVLIGVTHWGRLLGIYSIALMTLGMNHVRTLSAHRYLSTGEKMTHEEQFGDSINVTGKPIVSEILFPVGLRYHALHHLFPSIPYHSLGTAHRRLLNHFAEDSAYHAATRPSFLSAVRELLRHSRKSAENPPPGSQQWYASRRELNKPVAPSLDEETNT